MSSNLFLKQKPKIMKINGNEWIFINSNKTETHELIDDPIFLIQQFYIPKNKTRFNEIKDCLRNNTNNRYFEKIYLLNEKIYDEKQLGVECDSIEQVNLGNRLMVSDILDFVDKKKLKGYVVFSNSDIFFDKTLLNIRFSNISKQKKLYSQLRFEYQSDKKLSDCILNNNGKDISTNSYLIRDISSRHKFDSADTWIFHTNFKLNKESKQSLNRYLGYAGIDHIIPRVFYENGFEIANEPHFIKTYHFHEANYRQWFDTDPNKIKRYKEDYLFCIINDC